VRLVGGVFEQGAQGRRVVGWHMWGTYRWAGRARFRVANIAEVRNICS
jgi:hypothetical protein